MNVARDSGKVVDHGGEERELQMRLTFLIEFKFIFQVNAQNVINTHRFMSLFTSASPAKFPYNYFLTKLLISIKRVKRRHHQIVTCTAEQAGARERKGLAHLSSLQSLNRLLCCQTLWAMNVN
jgi:hypothetical protein